MSSAQTGTASTATRSGGKTHLRWIVPLLAAPLLYVGLAWGASVLSTPSGETGEVPLGMSLVSLLLLLLALALPIVAICIAIVAGRRVFRESQRARGKFTKLESAQIDRERLSRENWDHARALRLHLIGREAPAQIRSWAVVPNANEVFFYDVSVEYARYFGQDVSYSQSSGFFFGHPAFVLAGLGATAIGNASRRSAAVAAAREQWRLQQECRLLVSNQRLVCEVGGQWLSFYYSGMTAVYPEVESWTLITQFGSTSPLMLRGDAVPAIAVITTMMTLGDDALEGHPALKRLGGLPSDELSPA